MQNRTLTRLDIAYNGIGAAGAEALASVFPLNRTLKELDLRSNGLGPQGGIALARGILHNKGSLKVLKVADNKIGEAAAADLAGCMRGTTGPGLVSFGATNLQGPNCISGTLYGIRRERRPRGGSLDGSDDDDDDDGEAVGGGLKAGPPVLPGVRLLHGAL